MEKIFNQPYKNNSNNKPSTDLPDKNRWSRMYYICKKWGHEIINDEIKPTKNKNPKFVYQVIKLENIDNDIKQARNKFVIKKNKYVVIFKKDNYYIMIYMRFSKDYIKKFNKPSQIVHVNNLYYKAENYDIYKSKIKKVYLDYEHIDIIWNDVLKSSRVKTARIETFWLGNESKKYLFEYYEE